MREQWAQNEYHFLVSLTVGGIVECYQLYLNLHREDFNRYRAKCFHVNQASLCAYKQKVLYQSDNKDNFRWGKDSAVPNYVCVTYHTNTSHLPDELKHHHHQQRLSCSKCIHFS